jgi:DNA-binding GntR family transcriptional regulator
MAHADPAPIANAADAVASTSQRQRLQYTLQQAIAAGHLVPGQRLVEADLQAQYGVARSTVREALQALHAQGLVALATNRGAWVRQLSRREVQDLFAIRARLEGLAARRVAERQAAAALTAAAWQGFLRLHEQGMAQAQHGDVAAYAQTNRRWHQAVLWLADNPQLLRLVDELSLPVLQAQFRGFLKPANQRASAADHARIAAAMRAGDAARAERQMQQHVLRGQAVVLAAPDNLFAPDT